MKGTKDFYNKTAGDWAEKGYAPEYEMSAMIEFVKQFPSGSRFLDLCCGCGYDTQRIHKLGYDVVGIDFSGDSLNIAQERNPDATFYQDDLLNDYTYIGKVDAVIIIAGLVHIEQTQLSLAFSRMWDVLKDQGKLFVTVREGEGKSREWSIKVIDGEEYDRNFICHSLKELIDAASGLFTFEQEVGYDGTVWHNYVFKRICSDSAKQV